MALKVFPSYRYKDIDLHFTANPMTGDISTIEDDSAIKRSIQQLVLTAFYERPFHPEIGSSVFSMLFDNMDAFSGIRIAAEIKNVIDNFEPRASVKEVVATADYDKNGFNVSVRFYVLNSEFPNEVRNFNLFLTRLR